MAGATYVCGGDFRPSRRSDCPDSLHDWPLPAGYMDAAETADRRIRNGWKNQRCPQCGLFGWREGRNLGEGDTRVTYSPPAPSVPEVTP